MTVKTPTRTRPFIPYRKTTEIDLDTLDFDPYESVEKPDAMHQRNEQLETLNQIRVYFADFGESPDVFVDFDTNICYDPTNLRRHVSPDVYIAFGVDAKAIRARRLYLPWEVGKPPDFAMEIASPSTAENDVENKPRLYEEKIKAQELWMHDPSGGRYYKFPLKGLELVDGEYQEIELTTAPDGVLKGYSEVLGLSVAWLDGFPRLYDHANGVYIERVKELSISRDEERAGREAAEAQRDAEKERADAEKARADTAETQRDAFAAHLDMTEMQLESEIKARADERAASQDEIQRLQNLIRRMRNP